MLEVFERNWLARIASYRTGLLVLETPEILYIATETISPPKYARAIISDESKGIGDENSIFTVHPSSFFDAIPLDPPAIHPGFRGATEGEDTRENGIFQSVFLSKEHEAIGGDIIPIGDALLLSKEPRRFSDMIARLRGEQGPDKLIYLAGIADPLNLSLLFYLGADIVDSYGTLVRSSLGQVILNSHVASLDARELARILEIDSGPTFNDIYEHNLRQLEHELLIVRNAIRNGNLRQLVELRVQQESWMVQTLRYLDRDAFEVFEPWTPVTGVPFTAHSKESLWRPDIERFRRRIIERYIPPKSPEILLLLPCSAKKPYSYSRTHRRFREVIRKTGLGSAVHEVIITSPLGIVPRELELIYPAQQYDIPVTGHWDEDEIKMIQGLLSKLLAKRQYSHIIAHLDNEFEFLGDLLSGGVQTGDTNANSMESLQKLERMLNSIAGEISKPSWSERTSDDIAAISSYQFGEARETLLRDSTVRGRYPMVKVMRDGNQICAMVPSRGLLALTLSGGEALANSKKFGVEIEDFMPKSNIFAVGVTDAWSGIRIGDEVYIHHDDEVRAVGIARMNPAEMVSMKRGEAVHIRHYK